MKFLSEEWTKKHKEMLETQFNKENRNNVELVEIYENCYGEDITIWISYKMVDGKLAHLERGEGEDKIPEATFRSFGDYEDYVAVCKGQLDPKKGIMTGKFTLEGNLLKAMAMLGTYMKVNECKKFPEIEF